jgi:hypothetical protein
MATKKLTTLDKVTRTVTKAAKAVAATADEYVVEPVGKALGLNKKKPARKPAARPKVKAAAAKTTTKAKPKTKAAARKPARAKAASK